jgi:hypothetical protein
MARGGTSSENCLCEFMNHRPGIARRSRPTSCGSDERFFTRALNVFAPEEMDPSLSCVTSIQSVASLSCSAEQRTVLNSGAFSVARDQLMPA